MHMCAGAHRDQKRTCQSVPKGPGLCDATNERLRLGKLLETESRTDIFGGWGKRVVGSYCFMFSSCFHVRAKGSWK